MSSTENVWVKVQGVYLDPVTAALGDHTNIGIKRKPGRKRVTLWDDYIDTPTQELIDALMRQESELEAA